MYQLSAVCIQGVLGLLHFGEPIADDQPDTGDVSWLSRWLCQPMTPTRPKWKKLVVEEKYKKNQKDL